MLSMIVPTYNERKNIIPLIMEIENTLNRAQIADYEILIMDDDSPDGTVEYVEALKDPRVRTVNRRGRPRGLSNAVIDGFKEAKGEWIGVMDADLSHPPAVLPSLMAALGDPGVLVAIGSRYVPGGGISNWPLKRRIISRGACYLAGCVTSVKDATSGFFILKRSVLEGAKLDPYGFKIGLEVFVMGNHAGKVREVPYVFTDRREGSSKFGGAVMGDYLKQLFHLLGEKTKRVFRRR